MDAEFHTMGFDPHPDFQEYFRLFADSVMDHAFHTVSLDGRVTGWNRGAERMFGYSADEALGLPVEIFYTSEARLGRAPERELSLAREQGHCEVEGSRVRKDDFIIDAYVVMTLLRDDQHTPCGYAVVVRDITVQRRSLQEIHDQRRRLRSIVDTAVDAVVIIDEHGIVESFNPAGERLFGYKADEVIGRNVNMLMPEPFAAEHTGYIQRYLRTGQAKIIGIGREVQARRKDGTLFPADLAVSEFHDGKPLFTGILRDITDRKRMEAEVLEIAEAEQRRIGQELHDDTQQQLSGLTMIARHATDALAALVAQDARLADIHAKFERVVKGLRDANQSLRALARGLIPLHIDAHGLTEALSRLAAQISEQHTVQCTFAADGGVEDIDNTAAAHLYRIAQEAVNNSLKHSRADRISIRLLHVGRMFILEIADTGIGISDQREALGRGLQIMAYRAGLIGAVLSIRRSDSGGTLVSCSLPQGSC
jgi:two-component system sensor kinase FixL